MDDDDLQDAPAIAALHHLTGPTRGRTAWLSLDQHNVILRPSRDIRIVAEPDGGPPNNCRARLRRIGGTYLVEACGENALWVNRTSVTEKRLSHGDMIEFGEEGPLSRFEIIDDAHPLHRPVPDIFRESFAYFRVSRQPLPRRALKTLGQLVLQLALGTTLLFRIAVVIAIAAIAALAYQQGRLLHQLEESVKASQEQLNTVAAALAIAREEALTADDLSVLRQDVGRQLTRHVERLKDLEERWQAGAKVVAEATPSIVFVQGAFGLRDKESGRMLRILLDKEGRPIRTPTGNPVLTLEGDGPVADREFSGTGFVVAGLDLIVTNRHVALPWKRNPVNDAAAVAGLEPVMLKLVAYLPGVVDPVPVELARAGDRSDLAVLSPMEPISGLPGLELADAPPAIGSSLIVMGYPAGLRSMLAQSGEAFIKSLQETGELEFWQISRRLSEAGYIKPLASSGIVAQMTPTALVFDAETTHGASGGPVLDHNGRVVAIQSAILPEYGGSNLAVPVSELKTLLSDVLLN
jgi:serine protease Do